MTPPPPPPPIILLCRPVLAITDAGIIVYHITEKWLLLLPCCVCVCMCVCVCICVSECNIAYCDLWSDLHALFFSLSPPPPPPPPLSHVMFLWFTNNCEICQHHFCYTCIHLIYSLSFQSIFNNFALPVCLLLLIVVFYFICLYIVHPV